MPVARSVLIRSFSPMFIILAWILSYISSTACSASLARNKLQCIAWFDFTEINTIHCRSSHWIYVTALKYGLKDMSRLMTNTTKWHVCPAKTQISLGIRPIWSESSLSAWRKLGSLGSLRTHWTHSEDSDQTGLMPRLVWVLTGRIVTLLVLSCRGLFCFILQHLFTSERIILCMHEDVYLTRDALSVRIYFAYSSIKMINTFISVLLQMAYNWCKHQMQNRFPGMKGAMQHTKRENRTSLATACTEIYSGFNLN